MCLGVIRPQRKRAIVTYQRLVVAPQRFEDVGAIGMRVRVVRFERDGTFEACQRFAEPVQFLQRDAAIVEGEHIVGTVRKGEIEMT